MKNQLDLGWGETKVSHTAGNPVCVPELLQKPWAPGLGGRAPLWPVLCMVTQLCQERFELFLSPGKRTTRCLEFGDVLGSLPWVSSPGVSSLA